VDTDTFNWFNRLADDTAWLHSPAKAYAVYGILAFGVLGLLAWWDARRADDPPRAVAAVAWAGMAPLLGALMVQLIGQAVDRARPTAVIPGTHLLLAKTADFSFPSDHVTATTSVAVALILAGRLLRHRWYGWVGLGLSVLMALDRVYVGAHWPTDVLAGLALGALVAWLPARPMTALLSKVTTWLAGTPLRWFVSATALGATTT